jgi:hypothetical protein
MIGISLHAPEGPAAVRVAGTATPVQSNGWTVLNLTVSSTSSGVGISSFAGETLFLTMDGEVFIDWIRFAAPQ